MKPFVLLVAICVLCGNAHLLASTGICLIQRGSFFDHWPYPLDGDCSPKVASCEEANLPKGNSELEVLRALAIGGSCVAINDFARGHRVDLACRAMDALEERAAGLDLRYYIWFGFSECDIRAPLMIWKKLRQVTMPSDPFDYIGSGFQVADEFKRGHPGRELLVWHLFDLIRTSIDPKRCIKDEVQYDLMAANRALGPETMTALRAMEVPSCFTEKEWHIWIGTVTGDLVSADAGAGRW